RADRQRLSAGVRGRRGIDDRLPASQRTTNPGARTQMNSIVRIARTASSVLLLLVLGSCSTVRTQHGDGLALMAQGQYEEGIAQLEQDVKNQPGDFKRLTDLIHARERALNRLLAQAADERTNGSLERAAQLYGRVLGIDPGNELARNEL